jgi:hypothetical protein
MRLVIIGSLGVLALGSLAFAQGGNAPRSVERPFAEGGRVRLALSSGDYTLRAGASDRIVVRWTPDDRARVEDIDELFVDVSVTGNLATVTTDGSARHLNVIIELPARSDVHLRMRAGEVGLEGIEGHKDIRMTAGEIRIGVNAASLSRAHASVTFGDLDARALGISKSGIKRSLDWIGGGVYDLDARLGAGEIRLAEHP